MSYQCKAVQQPEQPALAIRTRTAVQGLPQALGQAYGAIAQYLAELGEAPGGAPFVAYYSMDMQDLDIEIGFPVSRPLPGRADIQSVTIPAGEAATCDHIGPYEGLSGAYEELNAWMKANGLEPTGVVYEYYLNSPQEVSPAELVTHIVFPLKGS